MQQMPALITLMPPQFGASASFNNQKQDSLGQGIRGVRMAPL